MNAWRRHRDPRDCPWSGADQGRNPSWAWPKSDVAKGRGVRDVSSARVPLVSWRPQSSYFASYSFPLAYLSSSSPSSAPSFSSSSSSSLSSFTRALILGATARDVLRQSRPGTPPSSYVALALASFLLLLPSSCSSYFVLVLPCLAWPGPLQLSSYLAYLIL